MHDLEKSALSGSIAKQRRWANKLSLKCPSPFEADIQRQRLVPMSIVCCRGVLNRPWGPKELLAARREMLSLRRRAEFSRESGFRCVFFSFWFSLPRTRRYICSLPCLRVYIQTKHVRRTHERNRHMHLQTRTRVHVRTCKHTHTHTRHTHARTHAHAHTHTHRARARAHTRTHTHTHTHTHTLTHSLTHTHSHTHTHTHTHTHACTYITDTHTHTHTHTHKHKKNM